MWTKLSDDVFHHTKVYELSVEAKLAFIVSITHAAKHLTDGYLSKRSIHLIINLAGIDTDPSDELVAAGLWETADGGYQIHDYLDYQWSRADVEARRAGDTERQRRKRSNDRHAVTHTVTPLDNALASALYDQAFTALMSGERAAIRAAAEELTAAGVQPEEVSPKVRALAKRWPDIRPTLRSLMTHWSSLTPEPTLRGTKVEADSTSSRRAADKRAALQEAGVLRDAEQGSDHAASGDAH